METTLKNFIPKTCYDYFQAYDITMICSLFVRILYFNYMLSYNKKRYRKQGKKLHKNNVILTMNYHK
jgi:hypothetical protein